VFGVTTSQIKTALEAMTQKKQIEDTAVYSLLRKIKVCGALIPHTPQRKIVLRQQIFSMIHHLGWPTFFITVSPNDLKSPLVKILRGNWMCMITDHIRRCKSSRIIKFDGEDI
jgi:hypothetical protein